MTHAVDHEFLKALWLIDLGLWFVDCCHLDRLDSLSPLHTVVCHGHANGDLSFT